MPHPGLDEVRRGGGPPTRLLPRSQSEQARISPGFTLPADLPLFSSAPIAVARVSLHLCATNAFKNRFLNQLVALMSQKSYQGEKTAKSSCAYQTSPSMAQTWNKQASISPRHPAGITKCSTLNRRFTTSLQISLIYLQQRGKKRWPCFCASNFGCLTEAWA